MEYDVKTSATLVVHEHLLRALLVAYLLRMKPEGDEPFREWVEKGFRVMNVPADLQGAPALEIQRAAIEQWATFWGRTRAPLAEQRAAKLAG